MSSHMIGYSDGKTIYRMTSEGKEFIKVYNDTGAAINNGDVFFLSFLTDADGAGKNVTLDACATTAVFRQVVVVNNSPAGKSSIADATEGWVQIGGYCPKVATTGVTAQHFIQGANASAVAADDGTSVTADSFGVALTSTASGFSEAILFGERSTIG